MHELIKTIGCVYQSAYHIVWRSIDRRNVLVGRVRQHLLALFSQIAGDKGFDLLACEVMPDHVHLFVSLPPTISVANAVKIFKGISARKLRMAFPELKAQVRSDHLWAPSYYFGTAGHVSAETIQHYIEEGQS